MTTYSTYQVESAAAPRRWRRIGGTALAALTATLTAAALLPLSSAAADTPPLPSDTHCAASYPLRTITSFDPLYWDWLHTVVDLNGNGYVCAKLQPDAMATALKITPPGYPIYLAADDSIQQ